MHINICDTLKQTRGKMMMQVNATNQLLKINNKSNTWNAKTAAVLIK